MSKCVALKNDFPTAKVQKEILASPTQKISILAKNIGVNIFPTEDSNIKIELRGNILADMLSLNFEANETLSKNDRILTILAQADEKVIKKKLFINVFLPANLIYELLISSDTFVCTDSNLRFYMLDISTNAHVSVYSSFVDAVIKTIRGDIYIHTLALSDVDITIETIKGNVTLNIDGICGYHFKNNFIRSRCRYSDYEADIYINSAKGTCKIK